VDARVLLEVTIGKDGSPNEIAVVKSPSDAYTEKALKAVKSWRFKPARDKDGNAIAARVPIQITFRRP
jgi:TonB family protein